MSARATGLTAIAGLASFALIMGAAFLVSPPLWRAPGTNTSAAKIATYLYSERVPTIASLLIYSLGIGMFLCFAAGLWRWFSQNEQAPTALSAVFAFGAVALVVLILASFVTANEMAYRPQEPAVAQVLRDLTFGFLALSGIPTAACLAAYAALIFKSRCLPVWTGWLAIVGALAHVLLSASFISHGGLLSVEGSVIVLVPGTFFIWICAASIALLRASLRGVSSTAAGTSYFSGAL